MCGWIHFEEVERVKLLVEEKSLLDALDDVLSTAHRTEILDHLLPQLFFVQQHFKLLFIGKQMFWEIKIYYHYQ